MEQNSPVSFAVAELGKHEDPKGSNWGPDIKKYLNSVGINFAASWCAAFVYWCFREAAFKANKPCPVVKTAGVMDHWNKGMNHRVTTPMPGDIFIMDFGKGLGHTGIVEYVIGEFIGTIEGNTNDDGSREGYEVARRKRKISACKGFLRYEI